VVSQAVETQHEMVLMKEASPQMHLGSMLQLAGRAWVMQEMAPNFCLSIRNWHNLFLSTHTAGNALGGSQSSSSDESESGSAHFDDCLLF
jgi:hypothetical protein